jgi:hypothetical protein
VKDKASVSHALSAGVVLPCLGFVNRLGGGLYTTSGLTKFPPAGRGAKSPPVSPYICLKLAQAFPVN